LSASRELHMALDKSAEIFDVALFHDVFQVNHGLVAPAFECTVFVKHKGDTTAHACCKIAACWAKHHGISAGHVLTAVVAHAFDNLEAAAVTDSKTFAGQCPHINLTTCDAIKAGVTNDDVFLCLEGATLRRINDDPAAGHTLGHVVIGIAFQDHA